MTHSNGPAGPQQTILVVDDTPENLTVLGQLLKPSYRVRVAPSGQRALQIAVTDPKPDLVLLDVMMPGMDGYEVIRQLRDDPVTQDIPVIFVTAMDSIDDEERGLKLGAVDYITKPIKPAIVLARVAAQLELKQARDWLKNQNSYLEAEVERRMRDNQLIQDISIRALASLAETRDTETGNHIRRTQAYVEVLARHLKRHPRFAGFLNEAMIRMVVKSAPLHDIGKVGIPDHILLKPGRLTPEEFETMKRHSRIGGDAIDLAMRGEMDEQEYEALQAHCRLGHNALEAAVEELEQVPLGFLAVAKDIALWHHEKWDGSGYPDGLAGEGIPVAPRLMALADVFDALVSRRIYKEPMPFEQAVELIRDGSGKHFDPDVVSAFLANLDIFGQILERFADTEESLSAKKRAIGLAD
ncbi:two-component system response regulator [Parasulfuritortus cantonensis]|uniref:Two-component system response regulator n=1 Tax=Parasulfuritortus cantonensis TaxID=2528202 RepID=A0A4R1B5T0_9PROT|nr:two-component system response regulator [Parasulfuritortus cantonensis]TCJ11877.1 two-component system response regulator [Parasulfuritortus cantonensis]